MVILGLVSLSLYSTYLSTLEIFLAGMVLLIVFFAVWMLTLVKSGRVIKTDFLRVRDVAIIALFLGIHKVAEIYGMFSPISAMTNEIPSTIWLTWYLPQGVIQAALFKIVPKPGVAFIYTIAQYFLLIIVSPLSTLWTLRYILPAIALETYYLVSKRGTLSSLVLMGMSFGIFSSSLGAIFFVYLWKVPQVLSLSFPVALMCGIAMAFGSLIGYYVVALFRRKPRD